ncbi:hypothetical protein TOPH_06919 [Tolypocladium ophioglossoides CBS 100239]|uniref:Major facilitator superfamily (MFS) profile domain-containing protein n=1 Tax=Tolypocladium ophioglossoides (strain CBS 100239) TaxID=1163406 RepID=A0A0L0N3D7_TOLOC|nr:hypothetical protein TOPH_06919 [Tolypocladium ophioglossoides CBS 100239]
MAAQLDLNKAAMEASCFPSDAANQSVIATPPVLLPKAEQDDAHVDGRRGRSSPSPPRARSSSTWAASTPRTSCRRTSLTSLTFVGSLATSFMASICILVGKAIRRFGYRRTALAGAVMMGLGGVLPSWGVDRLGALFVPHGVLFGGRRLDDSSAFASWLLSRGMSELI